MLRQKRYFLGDQVSSLDCIVYGHLALHLLAELPVQPLQSILKDEFPLLVQFVQNFREEFFSTTRFPYSQSIWIRKQKEPRTTSFSQLHQSLNSFARHIQQQAYQWMVQTMNWNRPTPLLTRATEDDVDTNPITRKTKEKIRESRTLSIIGGVCAFVFYVWFRGIVSIQIGDDDDEGVAYGVRQGALKGHDGEDDDDDLEEKEEERGSQANRAMKTEEEEEEVEVVEVVEVEE